MVEDTVLLRDRFSSCKQLFYSSCTGKLTQIRRWSNPTGTKLLTLERNLSGILLNSTSTKFTPPVHDITSQRRATEFESDEHMIEFSAARNSCKLCDQKLKVKQRIHSFCPAPQCGVYLHCLPGKNSFKDWHTKAFHRCGIYCEIPQYDYYAIQESHKLWAETLNLINIIMFILLLKTTIQ